MIGRIRYFLQVVVARAYVRVIGAQRELSWLVGDTLLPFLTVCAYIYVYRAMKAPPEYTGFVVLGGVIMTFWVHMLWSMAMQLFWEKETGNLARYLKNVEGEAGSGEPENPRKTPCPIQSSPRLARSRSGQARHPNRRCTHSWHKR